MDDNIREGVVIKLLSGFYYVSCGENVTECRARGVFRNKGQSPLVGDRVKFSVNNDGISGTVEEILPRKNYLVRPAAANIDRIVIISSLGIPAPNTAVIDRMTVIAEDSGIETVIVFNKSDLGSTEEYTSIYKNAGFKVIAVSAETGEGIDELVDSLADGINVFTGNTGVGKSSLINCILKNDCIKTGEVSSKLGRGRHTTRHIELFRVTDGCFVADTPGFSSLSFEGHEYIRPQELQFDFPDICKFANGCKFSSCNHVHENGCSVKKAVDDGLVEKTRYDSYVTLFSEMKEVNEWELKKGKIQ